MTFYQFAKQWVSQKHYPFTSQDIKSAYLEKYPNSNIRVSGGMMNLLCKAGLIKMTDKCRPSTSPTAKRRMIMVYISKSYSQAQQAKRKLDQPKLF